MAAGAILEILFAHKSDLWRFGVKSLALFGSAAKGPLRPDSDVDILVEFADKATFDGYMDLKFFLEDVLNRKVDLVTRKALREEMREQVEDEAVYVS